MRINEKLVINSEPKKGNRSFLNFLVLIYAKCKQQSPLSYIFNILLHSQENKRSKAHGPCCHGKCESAFIPSPSGEGPGWGISEFFPSPSGGGSQQPCVAPPLPHACLRIHSLPLWARRASANSFPPPLGEGWTKPLRGVSKHLPIP